MKKKETELETVIKEAGIWISDPKELEEALNQIKTNRYDALLKREGINDITNIALVFDGKRVYHKIEK